MTSGKNSTLSSIMVQLEARGSEFKLQLALSPPNSRSLKAEL